MRIMRFPVVFVASVASSSGWHCLLPGALIGFSCCFEYPSNHGTSSARDHRPQAEQSEDGQKSRSRLPRSISKSIHRSRAMSRNHVRFTRLSNLRRGLFRLCVSLTLRVAHSFREEAIILALRVQRALRSSTRTTEDGRP